MTRVSVSRGSRKTQGFRDRHLKDKNLPFAQGRFRYAVARLDNARFCRGFGRGHACNFFKKSCGSTPRWSCHPRLGRSPSACPRAPDRRLSPAHRRCPTHRAWAFHGWRTALGSRGMATAFSSARRIIRLVASSRYGEIIVGHGHTCRPNGATARPCGAGWAGGRDARARKAGQHRGRSFCRLWHGICPGLAP